MKPVKRYSVETIQDENGKERIVRRQLAVCRGIYQGPDIDEDTPALAVQFESYVTVPIREWDTIRFYSKSKTPDGEAPEVRKEIYVFWLHTELEEKETVVTWVKQQFGKIVPPKNVRTPSHTMKMTNIRKR